MKVLTNYSYSYGGLNVLDTAIVAEQLHETVSPHACTAAQEFLSGLAHRHMATFLYKAYPKFSWSLGLQTRSQVQATGCNLLANDCICEWT